MKRLKFQIVVVFDLDASVHDFWEFYKVESESGFGPETSFHPYDLFFRHTNLQKNQCWKTFVSKVKTELSNLSFQTSKNFQTLLNA
jgi:hypothetical protein